MTTTTPTAADVAAPTSLAEAREAVLDSAQRRAMVFHGGATKAEWAAPTGSDELVVTTSGLDRVVEHNPGDLTAVVGPGVTLGELQQRLADSGQWLAIDPPHADDGATVGGVYAAGDAGPRRLAYGTMRDLVIGVTVVCGDGTVARSGGKIIKNVAGYDLGKLLSGSYGTLGLVGELVIRLHPRPEARRTLRVTADAAAATRLVAAVLASPVTPTALEWVDGQLWVCLEGREPGVAAQTAALQRLTDDHGLTAEQDEHDRGRWQVLAAEHTASAGQTLVRAVSLPDKLGAVAEALQAAAAGAGVSASLASHAGSGVHSARLSGGDATTHARAIASWRDRVAALGGAVTVRERIAGLADYVELAGPAPSAVGLMRRIKAELDPQGRCAPGRLGWGI
jgi:glycolate oxidase FAD binding subunit